MSVLDSITQARQKGATDDQIIAEIVKQNPQKAPTFQQAQKMGANSTQILEEVVKQNNGSVEPPNQGFFSRIKNDFQERGQKVTESQNNYVDNPTLKNLGQSGFNIAGQFAGGALDIVSEAVKSVIPKAAEQGLAKFSNKIADVVTENPRVLAGLHAINNGIDKYDEWKTQHPEDAKSLEAVVNIGTLFAGAKADVNLNNLASQGKDIFTSLVEKQKTKSALTAQEARLNGAIEKVTPDYESLSPTKKIELQNQTFNGQPRVQEGGIFKGRKVISNSIEHKAGEELAKIPGFDSNATHLETHHLIKNEITREANILKDSIQSEQIIAPKREIVSVVKKGIEESTKDSLLLSKSDPVLENYMRVVNNAVSQNDGTLGGVLDVRKALDSAYENARGKLAFGSDRLSALDEIHQGGRNALNKYLIEKSIDTDVKASLLKQSNLYRADDVVNTKAAREGGNAVKRFAKKHPNATKAIKYAGIGLGGHEILKYTPLP